MPVRIGSGLSTAPDARAAAEQAAGAALEQLGGAACDVCVLFASGSHLAAPEATMEAVDDVLAPGRLVGCGAQGVLGGGREVERGTGVAVWAASLGAGSASAFHTAVVETDAGLVANLPDLAGASAAILLADPFTFPADAVLHAMSGSPSRVPVVGGLASARLGDGAPALFLDGGLVEGGAVGLRFDGVDVQPCVSQGAAPLGPELTITAAEGNIILELAGQAAYEKLQEVVGDLGDEDQVLLERSGGILLGIVVDPNKPEYVQGDFLVRPLIGGDPRTGAVAVGAVVRIGQVVRLHARDADSADRDLREALHGRRRALAGPPAGALVFACNGRGQALFGEPDHDAGAVAHALAGAPSAGFFCAGEIGPVGGECFLHGFTATIALFGHSSAA
jgi:small ligand-binding sensory domain FIST